MGKLCQSIYGCVIITFSRCSVSNFSKNTQKHFVRRLIWRDLRWHEVCVFMIRAASLGYGKQQYTSYLSGYRIPCHHLWLHTCCWPHSKSKSDIIGDTCHRYDTIWILYASHRPMNNMRSVFTCPMAAYMMYDLLCSVYRRFRGHTVDYCWLGLRYLCYDLSIRDTCHTVSNLLPIVERYYTDRQMKLGGRRLQGWLKMS